MDQISSSLIVGRPKSKQKYFRQTMQFVPAVRLDQTPAEGSQGTTIKPKRKPSQAKPKPKKEKPVIKMTRIDHTALWTRGAKRRRRFNPMDPKPDTPDEEVPEHHEILKDKHGKIKLVLTPDDWKKFWVDRIRRHYQVDAPSITDKEIYHSVDRSRRIYLRNREEGMFPHADPDMPPCYYWDKFQVAQWAQSIGAPEKIVEIILHCEISGRRLILLNATNLSRMGLQDLEMMKSISKAVRQLLGLPDPNGLRAISRLAPLERFLHQKIRTGPNVNRLTFKQFCEQEGIDYEPAQIQKNGGYKKLPKCLKITIRPEENEEIKWIPVPPKLKQPKPRHTLPYFPYAEKAEYDIHGSGASDDSSSSDGISLVEWVPTVEELLNNAMLRDQFIPDILNGIVEAVFQEIKRQNAQGKCRQQLADRVLQEKMKDAYSYFNITDQEEKLKLVTLIAEELVQDVMKAREMLEDIDKVQEKMKDIPKEEMLELQEAVSQYVQDIMPHVVSAALKEMRESEEDLRAREEQELDPIYQDSIQEICLLKSPSDFDYSADSEISSDDDKRKKSK